MEGSVHVILIYSVLHLRFRAMHWWYYEFKNIILCVCLPGRLVCRTFDMNFFCLYFHLLESKDWSTSLWSKNPSEERWDSKYDPPSKNDPAYRGKEPACRLHTPRTDNWWKRMLTPSSGNDTILPWDPISPQNWQVDDESRLIHPGVKWLFLAFFTNWHCRRIESHVYLFQIVEDDITW